MKKRTVLVAGMGITPAVLSETIWALAVKKPAVVPDEVVVITMRNGAERLKESFFGAKTNGWKRLTEGLKRNGVKTDGKLRFGPTQSSIRIIANAAGTDDLEEAITPEDVTRMADDILLTLRGFTEDPSTTVYASIAGGRKTMSALMLSCMSLLGRDGDHVLHVLVNAPFDRSLKPEFLFPERGRTVVDAQGRKHRCTDAKIDLIDLPFVKMRGWYQGKFHSAPPSYGQLVSDVQNIAPQASVEPPDIAFDTRNGDISVDGKPLRLSPQEFMVLATDLLLRPPDLGTVLLEIKKRAQDSMDFGWFGDFGSSSRFDNRDSIAQDLAKVRSSLRKNKMEPNASIRPYIKDIVPRGTRSGSYPRTFDPKLVRQFRALVGIHS